MKSSTRSLQGGMSAKPLIKSMKKVPSQLIKDQSSGKSIIEQFPKPKIIQFLNIGDNSIHTDSQVHVDEPLFAPTPHVIQFTNYEPLQTKQAVLTLRNKDRVARSVKIIPPDSKLFSVTPAKKSQVTSKKSASLNQSAAASEIDQMSAKVAPGMDITFIVKFSPEAKSDYAYDLMVMTEREKFIVPIRARGCRAMLDFPDQLDFGLVPVKYETEKPVIVRNIGEKTTKWKIIVPNNFRISQSEGILEVGQITQVVFLFVPQEARKYQEELTLQYDGLEAQIPVVGEAHNDNVYLSKSHIHTEPTSITLFSHQYYQIVNKSAVPIEFSWRAFATDIEEQQKKQRLNLQLSQEEQEEREEIEKAIDAGEDDEDDGDLDSDDSYDATEQAAKQERRKERAIATLNRKYMYIRKAVEEDKMLFQDEIFQIEPLEGKIWPNTEMTCSVTFRPQGPYHYSCTAFANVTCNQERLNLNLTGQGKGPQAQLSITEMDIGDIFVTNQKSFELGIENTGEIDCHWKLIPYETPFGSKFHFSKTDGILGVREHVRDLLRVTFMSDILGEFSETFRIALEGSSEMLTLTFKGHVVAPTFRFSEDIINFGKVSYKFAETKKVYLTNTSEVDINYVVRVPGDGRSLQNEFNIINDRGKLAKDSKAEIIIEFVPCVPHVYDMVLVVDLEGVGQDMLAVPIKAECIVPKVKVQPNEFLQFDNCFLKHPKTKQIQIINEDNLKARFEIVPQDEQSKRVATYDVDKWNGVIEPHSTQIVNVKLQTEILGPVRTNFVVKIDGHNLPVMMLILASSGGPDVKLDTQELDFGSVDVLKDQRKKFTITNVGQIDAEYTAFTKNKDSIWKVIERYGVIKAKEEKQITVVCTADEVQKFQDTLHIIVNNGVDVEVQLKAKGIGTTLYCKERVDNQPKPDLPWNIDFGTEYTYKHVPRQFFLENRGRKPMKIMWTRQNKQDRKKKAGVDANSKSGAASETAMKKTGSVSGAGGEGAGKDEEQFVFSVVPDQVTLGPKMGIMIEVRAFSHQIGQISEPWQCQYIIGSDRKPKVAWSANIFANFITPSLQFNNPKLEFKYEWEKGVQAQAKIENLTIKNTGPLKTTLGLKIEPPFSCSVETLTLEKDGEDTVRVEFDPSSKQDRVSDTINGKLVISHEGHPHKDIVPLSGQVCFPNLQILPPKIDFGCILNDTSKKKYLLLTNISEMAVAYEWSFLEDAPNIDEQEEIDADNEGKRKKTKKKKKHLPINEVFDILPVSGILQPGQTENVEFTFYAGNGLNYKGMAVVSVDGGPDYDVEIAGESNNVSFRLSTNNLDFGEVAYNESQPRDFFIENIGKVPFEFNVNLSTLSRQGVIECSHMTGKVLANERFKISVKFYPGIPDNINETFLVECGHFPAEKFTIKGVGIYPGCVLSFPRVNELDFTERADRIKPMLEKGDIKYTALFHGHEAQKMLQPIPPKMVDKEKVSIDDPFLLDIAAEVDRQMLCEKIINFYEDNSYRGTAIESAGPGDRSDGNAAMATSGALSTHEKNINIASYLCDFGNVIISKTAKRSFRLTNTGKMKISFNFKKEALNAAGLDIEPDKVANLMPNASQFFNVVLTTRKTSKFGKQRYLIPIDIKNGPKYTIEFTANLTIPELKLDPETLDFDRVCINTRKTVKIRLENHKEVPCDWSFNHKAVAETTTPAQGTSSKTASNDVERFQVWPHSGTLQPGQRQTVDVMFTPNADKVFTQKLAFKCSQNSNKQFILNVKGQGIYYQTEMVPETIKLGPVLPYDRSAIQEFELRNPMDQPIEIYSLDFDKQYLEEEEILKRIENFQPNGSNEPLFLPLRKPGSEFWPSVKQQDENKRRIDAIKAEIKANENQLQEQQAFEEKLIEYNRQKELREQNPKDEKGQDWPELQVPEKTQEQISEARNLFTTIKGDLESKLADIMTEQQEVKMPPALKEEKRLNVILVGPDSCGRTTAANYLAQEHQRALINVDKLIDFWQKRGHALGDEATKYLEEQDLKLQEALAEAEKKKKAKKGKKDVDEEIDPAPYKYLPKELIQRMLVKRLQEDDCNAGAVFDNLTCQYWPNQNFAIELICDAVPQQNVQVVVFNFNKETQEADILHSSSTDVVYASRMEVSKHESSQEDEKKEDEKVVKVLPSNKKNAPKSKKETAQVEADEKAAKNAEQEQKIKEIEIARKKAEEAARASYKAKDYTNEDKAQWLKAKLDFEQFFSSIVTKQNNAAQAAFQIEEEKKDSDVAFEGQKYGKRFIREQSILSNFVQLCNDIVKIVAEPEWPDPDNEPLPEALINSIQRKPPTRAQRIPITKFSIWTPIQDENYKKDGDQDHVGNSGGADDMKMDSQKLPPMTDKQTRWVLQPKESKKLYVKFFSTKTGQQDQVLQFEIVGSYKTFNLNAKASCDFPTISQNPRNLYLTQKKTRPPTEPDSFLSKTFVVSENVFDFGPLLIGKNPEKREDPEVKKVNGTFFQITNNGKYDLEAQFVLKSSLPIEEGGPTEKSPFIIEPAEAKLKVDETLNLQVFAFPDEAKLYKDEIICLLKDNPNPTILQIQCLGAQPVVKVDRDVVKFERALIGKTPKQELVLTNACSIPVNWKLMGVEKLPEEFSVTKTTGLPKPPAPKKETKDAKTKKDDTQPANPPIEAKLSLEQIVLRTSGRLEPGKSETIEVTFNSLKSMKFLEKITLQVEDVENYSKKQEDKIIQIDAEAFNISLNETMATELDFGAVRVGEPKELPLYLKNQGQYPISFDFKMKKALTKQMFTITPMQGQLNPNEDININVKFMSKVEKKLTKSKQNSDITMIILEGQQQEEHQQIPILVSVEAVFSKFTISPLRNLNFGPMQFGNEMKRTFEIKNDGQFEFKYAIFDFNNQEERAKIKEERQKELEGRLTEKAEEKEEAKGGKAPPKKAPDPKAKAPVKGGKAEVIPDGTVCQVSQYTISPSIGSIAPDSSAIITVSFNAKGAKFYDSTICVDIANRDPGLNPDGIPFQLCAESSIPGINATDFDQIFEEQTVIPSLDPSLNTQTVITSSLYSMQENVFWFGTMVASASKSPEGTRERFKIINPNKIPCTVKFVVKPRSTSKSEGFAFDVQPEGLTIDPHKHKYVSVGFNPTAMMQYCGIFEAIVESGNQEDPTGKLVFELRGEGTLPTLQVEKPDTFEPDGTPSLKFKKTRIGKDAILPIILKNEGQVPATARFDAITNEQFIFEGNMNHTISQKQYNAFDIRFKPRNTQVEKFLLTFSTMNNVFEQHKVWLIGEGFNESITFEGLPKDLEDELAIGDCIIGKAKAATYSMVNNGDKDIKFKWNSGDKDEFKFYPNCGHLKAKSSKRIKVMVRGTQSKKYDKIDLTCEVIPIEQKGAFADWDDTMKTLRMVRPSEYRLIMKKREDEEKNRIEAAEAAAAQASAGKKGGAKPPPAKGKAEVTAPVEEEKILIDENEQATQELIEVIPEPDHTADEATKKSVILKTSCVIDYSRYDCSVKRVDFKPTLMYAQRIFKFTIKNTAMISLNYNFKIANSMTGVLDAGPYSIMPKQGTIAPGCDDNFIVKFNPLEVEADMSRILSANILNLNPDQEPLIIETNGIAERPVIHFELPPTNYRERKEKDMSQVDSKYKIIEFESLGTNIKNTKRFMAVNPTNQGYEFEWEEIIDESNKQKPLFKCTTQKGLILSGKKSEMCFEYIPDTVGEHESRWVFRIPSQDLQAQFLVVGRVNEPNVLLEQSRIKFGPLLLQGRNKEIVKIINQEHIPFAFNFSKESVRGNPDFGDSLKVTPMTGVVPALSDLPIEIAFTPKYELKYNYNLQCNIKRKNRPLILNVKGEGYKIHHTVFADEPRVEVQAGQPFNFDFGEFFINEKKTKKVVLTNNGEFNFDFVWRRQLNKNPIKITPETGTVQKGSEVTIDIDYAPSSEHEMTNFKMTLNVVSGPKYDFQLTGKARKPGVKLNQHVFNFGSCFVTSQPAPIKQVLEIINQDTQAISLETNFEKKTYLDFPVVPGTVLMPGEDHKLQIPIVFCPREIRKYNETIRLDFNNGNYFVDLQISGQGVPLNLDLKDPDHQTTDLGTVSVGGVATRIVPIINRSSKSVKFTITPENKEAFNKAFLTITPDEKEITLKPKETLPVEIKFKPKTRLPNFEHNIMLKIDGIEDSRKLFKVIGVAHGIELKIMDEVISFGQVVKDSRLTKTLQMSNFGDVKANFEWEESKFSQNFTISPARGYVNPNSNLDMEVTFHPKYVDQSISQKVICTVQGGEPISLTMMGKCVAQEGSQTLELKFNTLVRKATTQNVTIQNTEDREWTINPTISTKSAICQGYYTSKPLLVVPARGSASYEIVYLPKTMTTKEKPADSEVEVDVPHQGSLFFPLPNGTALLYNLNGLAGPPESDGAIVQTVSAKKQHNFIVQVKNWSKQTQRFSAEWKIDVESPSLFIRGAKVFDVPGENKKEYKLNFLALKAGVYKFKTTFKAKDSGEYLFYTFQITVEDNSEVETIVLESPIRESVTQSIIIENPTDEEVVVNRSQFQIQNEYCELQPDSQIIKAHETREFTVRYLPLMISESEADMILKNPILGDFRYKLKLKGVAPTSQRSLAFKCALGQDQMQAFKFSHFLRKQTTYTVKVERIDGPGACDFKADVATVPAAAAVDQRGVDLQVNVRYEPFTIGDSRGVLKLTSPEGMEYSCLLFGKSSAPQPQGPIRCVPGAKPIGIDFKNPLNEKCDFAVNFDNPNFSLASKLPGPLDPGKVTNLQIKYDAKADLPNTGRMIVTTRGLPPWIFYLQGD